MSMTQMVAPPVCRSNALTRSVLFSDVVESTNVIDTEGEIVWLEALDRHARLMSTLAAHHRGSVSSFLGDGFMVMFDDAASAVSYALRVQVASSIQGLLGIRIGIDHGDVYPYRDWWVGRTIHVTARLTELCEPGHVYFTRRCYDAARERMALPGFSERLVSLRGLREPLPIRIVPPPEQP